MDMEPRNETEASADASDALMAQPALDALAVAPPPDSDDTGVAADHAMTDVRPAHDAGDVDGLSHDPSDEDLKLEVALDETFPGSDAPSNTQPGKGKDPAPSSGYDAAAEDARLAGR